MFGSSRLGCSGLTAFLKSAILIEILDKKAAKPTKIARLYTLSWHFFSIDTVMMNTVRRAKEQTGKNKSCLTGL